MTDTISKEQQRIIGAQALAQGALAAGVQVVSGYPGSPATEVFDHLAQRALPHIAWAANEKVAAEIVAGASLGGSRALLIVKSVGLNVALDPLATLAMTGCRAGMVILVGDDPGASGSQNEQDSRWLARTAELPLVEPTSVAGAAALVAQAFAWSESAETPVIVRFTTSLADETALVEAPWRLPPSARRFLFKEYRWISYPPLVQRRHKGLHRRLRHMAHMFEASPYDRASGNGPLGILAVGHTHAKVERLLRADLRTDTAAKPPALLGLSSSWPLPEESLCRWLAQRERLLILEEGGSFVEEQIGALCQRRGLPVAIRGRLTETLPLEGELSDGPIAAALHMLWPAYPEPASVEPSPPQPVDLCDGCHYDPIFGALTTAMEDLGGRRQFITVGETGCMVRGLTRDETLLDVKLSLGSALGLGLGLTVSNARQRVVALVGDSCLFHSDLNALPQVAAARPNMLILILQNRGAALTGGQPYPTSIQSATPTIAALCAACGIEAEIVDARRPQHLQDSIRRGLAATDLRVMIIEAPCALHTQDVDA